MEERISDALDAATLAKLCNMSIPALAKTVFLFVPHIATVRNPTIF